MTPPQIFTLSPSAIRHLRALQAQGKTMLRIRIVSGGCVGFQYVFSFEDAPLADDIHIQTEGVHVVIDPVSLPFIQQGELDYVEELIGSSFVIKNPNAQGSCGCGSSFAP